MQTELIGDYNSDSTIRMGKTQWENRRLLSSCRNQHVVAWLNVASLFATTLG